MTAQTWSVDRQWHKEHNKQKMDLGKQAKDARNRGRGKEKKTSSNWAKKSRQKQEEAGLGTYRHPQRSPSPMTSLPSGSKHATSYRARHTTE